MIKVPPTIEITPIPHDFAIVAPEKVLSLDSDLDHKVEMAWQLEKEKRRGNVFDGSMLSFLRMERERLIGEYVPYKVFVAQLVDSQLRKELSICPVGVSGIVTAPGGVLMGQRSSLVTQYAGYYELSPSGSISTDSLGMDGVVDFRMQLLVELYEETRISPDQPTELRPFILTKDKSNPTVDICCVIPVEGEVQFQTNEEYPVLEWLPYTDVRKFVEENSTKIVPPTLAILSVAEKRGWL